jgi:DNA-binding beta-propeller fold protein YncE
MRLIIIQLSLVICFSNCKGQTTFGEDKLKLEKKIEMPEVKGRIDHMAINLKDKLLYMAALGNNSVEVIDLNKGSVIRSIKGVEEPQGIAYIPEQNEIAVASGGNGDCVFFNATTFENVATIHLAGDADNIRYDAAERKMYVGYGNGAMALIDPIAHKQIGNVKLSAHPESFQLDKKNNKLYVNLPDDRSITIIDLKSFTIADTWKISKYRANFPMTLDTANNLVLVGYRHPAVLVNYDSKTGKQVSTNELVGDVDDVFYYGDKKEILASGGDGYINIFQKGSDNTYKLVSNISSRLGARTSLLIPSLRYYILAERANGGKAATVAVYKIND